MKPITGNRTFSVGILITFTFVFTNCIGLTSFARPITELLEGEEDSPMSRALALGAAFSANKTNGGGGSTVQTIGASGGTLTTNGVTLDIPAGALQSDQNIQIYLETADINTFPGYTPATPVIRLEPDGLQFKKPVTLTAEYGKIHALSALGEDMVGLYYSNPATGKVERLDTTRDNGTVTTQIEHFSIYGALYLSVEEVVQGTITDPVQIDTIANDFVTYVQSMPSGFFGIGNQARRNYFYAFYAPTLLPFLNIVEALPTPNPATAAFPTDDFDGDGINNTTDPYPFDPTNSGDVTPPTVVSATPNTTGVPLAPGGNIVVTFDEPVSLLSVQNAATISDGNAVYALAFESLDPTGTIATYSYGYTLQSDQTYAIRVEGARDLVNNEMVPNLAVTSFTTVDQTLPQIVSVSPSGANVPLATNQITIQFSEAMNSASLAGLSLIGVGSSPLTLNNLSPDGRTATFDIAIPLVDSFLYILNLAPGITDQAGNPLAIPASSFWFQMVDQTAPLAYSITPTGTHINPDTPPALRVRFTEPVVAASVAGIIGISGGTNPGLTFAGLDATGLTAIYNFSGPLDQETDYTVTVNGNYIDPVGNLQNQTREFTFKTADTIPPQIVGFAPTGGNIPYLSGVTFSITFDEGIEEPTLAGALSVTHQVSGTALPVTYSHYDAVSFTAFYTVPTASFAAYEDYDYAVAPTVTDDYANGVTGTLASTFRTQSFSDPQLVAHSVDQCGSTLNVRLVYDRRMDVSGLNASHGLRLYHSYARYETRNFTNHPNCWNPHHRYVDPNPNLNPCVVGGCFLNPGGCVTGAILAACLIAHPPYWEGAYTPNPCPVANHYGYSDYVTIPFKYAVNNGETLVFEVNHSVASSSNGIHAFNFADFDYWEAASTRYLPDVPDLDGKIGPRPFYTNSPNLPTIGNTCP